MKKTYEVLGAELLVLANADVLTESADFTDSSTGDNGVWFPGSTGGTSQWN